MFAFRAAVSSRGILIDVYDRKLPLRVRRDLPPPDDPPLPKDPPPADGSPPLLRLGGDWRGVGIGRRYDDREPQTGQFAAPLAVRWP
jgi:hypothetical protein